MRSRTADFSEADLHAVEEQAREAARGHFLPFILYTKPDYRLNWHHRIIADAVERWAAREVMRLILCAPPQTGKSTIVSRHGPAFILGQNPDARVICGSYSADLASEMATDVHKIVGGREYRDLFPSVRLGFEAKREEGKVKERANVWGIAGHEGGLKAVGRGGGVSGFPADYAIVDDPFKGREEANSRTIRNKAWDWLQEEILTRLGAAGPCLIMHTRWHEDDLVGRIKRRMREDPEAERWEIIELPARLDGPGHPKDPRAIGDPLWPWYYAGKRDGLSRDEEMARAKEFLKKWEKASPSGFASLGQQSPKPRTGNMFEVSKIKIVSSAPAKVVKSIRYWDKAATQDGGKRTAGGRMARLANGQYLIQHIRKGQWGTHVREQNMRAQAEADGREVEIWLEQEPGSGGKDSASGSAANLAGFKVKLDRPTGDKETRAEPLADQVGAENVLMLRGDWNQELLDEMEAFPLGTFKDQVDSLSGAFNKLAAPAFQYGALAKR